MSSPLLTAEEEEALGQDILVARLAEEELRRRNGHDLALRRVLEHLVQEGRAARERLITANQALVVRIAERYQGLGVDLPDLVQEGNLGLMKAVEKFAPWLGHRFSTYATWWVRQAVSRAVVNQGRTIRLPARQEEALYRLRRQEEELAQDLGREPGMADLEAEVPEAEELAAADRRSRPVSPDAPVGERGVETLGDLLPGDEGIEEEVLEQVDTERLFRAVLQIMSEKLTPRQTFVLCSYYGLDGSPRSLREIGDILGVSPERVRQIRDRAIERLQATLIDNTN